MDVFEWISRRAKEKVFAKEQAAMFAFLDADELRAEFQQRLAGFDYVLLFWSLLSVEVLMTEFREVLIQPPEIFTSRLCAIGLSCPVRKNGC